MVTASCFLLSAKEVQHHLCQLILLNGMLTDANQPGVEKICVTLTQTGWLASPYPKDSASHDLHFEGGLASPGEVFAVKGWNRCVCLLGICLACYMDSELVKAQHLELWAPKSCILVEFHEFLIFGRGHAR